MEKKLKLTLEQAIQYYNSSTDKGFKEMLEEHFGKGFWRPKEIYNEVNGINPLIAKLGYDPRRWPDSTHPFERYLDACSVLARVAEVYNQGKVVPWNGSNYHYIPYQYFSFGGGVSVGFAEWCSCLRCSGRLYYNEEKLARESYNNFKQYWEEFWSV